MSTIRLILPDENDVEFVGVRPPETYTTNNGEYVLVRVGDDVDVVDDASGHHEDDVTTAWYARNPAV